MSRKRTPLKPWLRVLAIAALGGAAVIGTPGEPWTEAASAGPGCTPATGTTAGLVVNRWNAGDSNTSNVVTTLTTASFDGTVLDAGGFPTRAGAPDFTGNTTDDGADVSGEPFSRTEWDALRVEGWISAPCAATSWQLRFTVGGALGTYLGAVRQGAAATAADALTAGGIDGDLVGPTLPATPGSRPSAMLDAANLQDPVSVVELIEDRGGIHNIVVEESIDGAEWSEVPGDRLWADEPSPPPPPPPPPRRPLDRVPPPGR